jgi:uncharacterized protein YxjI
LARSTAQPRALTPRTGRSEYTRSHPQYYVTVAPGVDLALIAAVCICFDEIKHDDD